MSPVSDNLQPPATPRVEDTTSGTPGAAEPRPVDLLTYLRQVGRRWLVGVVVLVLVGGLGLAWAAVSPNDEVGSVTAHAHVAVTMPAPSSVAQATVLAGTDARIIAAYTAIDGDKSLISAAVSNLHDGTTAATMSQAVSLYSGGGSNIIAVYGMGRTPAEAIKRANAYAKAFVEHANDILPAPVSGVDHPKLTIAEAAFVGAANPSKTASTKTAALSKLASPAVIAIVAVVAALAAMVIAEGVVSRRRPRP